MNITLNGTPHEIPAEYTVLALVTRLELGERRIAIEVNQEIVPRSAYAQWLLHAGDQVEVVQAIGGG